MLKSICADIERQLQDLAGSPLRQAEVARALLAIGKEDRGTEPGVESPLDDLTWRLAWLIFILAPSLDESFIVTMPMRLEMISDQRMELGDVLDDIRAAELECPPERAEFASTVAFQLGLPTAPASTLRPHVLVAVRALRSDPSVLDRVIESIAHDSEPPLLEAFEDSDPEMVISLGLPRSRRHGLD